MSSFIFTAPFNHRRVSRTPRLIGSAAVQRPSDIGAIFFFVSETAADAAYTLRAAMTPKLSVSDEYASDLDVEAAVRALSVADLLRLRRWGDRLAASLRARGVGVDGDDLLQTAIERTLDRRRKWPKKVQFVSHLMQTMSSVASHDKKKHDCVRSSDDVAGDADGSRIPSPFGPPMPGPEVDAAAREEIARIEKLFEEDVEAALVIDGHEHGRTGPEIQQDLGMTQREYETVMTRIRRGLDRKSGWRP